jgi:hypothetical protein
MSEAQPIDPGWKSVVRADRVGTQFHSPSSRLWAHAVDSDIPQFVAGSDDAVAIIRDDFSEWAGTSRTEAGV